VTSIGRWFERLYLLARLSTSILNGLSWSVHASACELQTMLPFPAWVRRSGWPSYSVSFLLDLLNWLEALSARRVLWWRSLPAP